MKRFRLLSRANPRSPEPVVQPGGALPDDTSSDDHDRLHNIGEQAERSRRMAIFDQESGLFSRWYLELRLHEECLRAGRYDLSISVLSVRSTSALTTSPEAWARKAALAAERAARSVRCTDLTASLGRGEFAVCLLHCDRRGAANALRRLMDSLEGSDWQVGLASFPDDAGEGKALLELAISRYAPWRIAA